MKATNKATEDAGAVKICVDVAQLQAMLGCGNKAAVAVGTAAKARVQIGRRVLWNVAKIQRYIDEISE